MVSPSDTILLFDLSPAEKDLVQGLLSSFEIETVDLSLATIGNFAQHLPEKKVCLIVYHIDENLKKQNYIIRVIRAFVGDQIPFLVLVPPQKADEIEKYLQAGADDYMELPLNENRFSIGFLILLELGQAISRPGNQESQDRKESTKSEYGWQRIINYFQKELSYFSPKSLIQKVRSEGISERWRQVKKLGQGGFGVVWLVEEIGTGRLAVAKIPHSPEMNIRILRSAAILKRLIHHPNIVHLVEVVREAGRLILIQEYVDGPTLQELLEVGISGFDKETCFLQLLSAVSYAHTHKIMHRDIKPENIIINRAGQLKLLDFGIAQDLSWQSPGRTSVGTLNFMPPEQFEGKSCIASDVWALGVILYIFAANAVPYLLQNDNYPVDIELNVEARAPRKINPNLPVELEKIIMRCLQRDLLKRYRDATELQEALRTACPRFGKGEIIPGSR